jgi:uncharacterized Rmd1/YagE family protein
MINTQRLVKPVANWSRRSLIPFATPFQTHESVPMRVSARMLLPTSFSIQTGELFQSIKKQANLFPIDIRLLSQRIGGPHDSVFLDSSGAFLYINYADQLNNQYKSTAVIFPDGALVTWYMKREEEIMLASNILSLHSASIKSPLTREELALDQFYGLESIEAIPVSNTPTNLSSSTLHGGEMIALTREDSSRSNEMLAISMAMSSAVRLNVIESSLNEYIRNGHAEISGLLSKLSQWRLAQVSASVFETEKGVHKWRYFLTSTHQGNAPDTLWEYEQLDRIFNEFSKHFEVEERLEDLQNQLTYYSDYLRTVGDYVRHGYSSRLEKIIIAIIAIETAIALRHLFMDLIGK